MTDDPASPKPLRAEVTEAWPEPEPENPGATTGGRTLKPSRGKIHDKRQGSYEV